MLSGISGATNCQGITVFWHLFCCGAYQVWQGRHRWGDKHREVKWQVTQFIGGQISLAPGPHSSAILLWSPSDMESSQGKFCCNYRRSSEDWSANLLKKPKWEGASLSPTPSVSHTRQSPQFPESHIGQGGRMLHSRAGHGNFYSSGSGHMIPILAKASGN